MDKIKLFFGVILFLSRHVLPVDSLVYDHIPRPVNLPEKCVSYEKLLPKGYCIKELGSYKVYQSEREANKTNIGAEMYKLISLLLSKNTKAKVLAVLQNLLEQYPTIVRFDRCPDIHFQRLVTQGQLYLKEHQSLVYECLQSVMDIFCHVLHPVCLTSGKNTILSPPCRRLCVSSCDVLLQKIRKWSLLMYKLCPNHTLDPTTEFVPSSCSAFPVADIRNIERCQIVATKNYTKYTSKCYEGLGENYNGTVNVTATGKACLPWKIIPFLSSNIYKYLENNFCRNPQGYATAPWCYVSVSNRNWKYCDIQRCKDAKEQTFKNSSSNYQIILYVLAPTFIFVTLFFLWKKFYHRIHNNEAEQSPYYTCNVEDSEKRTELIVQFQESLL